MRCLVVEDHPLTRDGTAVALRAAQAAVEVHEADSLEQAKSVLSEVADIELVLLDLDLPDSHGIETLQGLKAWADERDLRSRFVVLSAHGEPELVREIVSNLGTGFILKATPRQIFQHAIGLTLAGGVYIPEMALKQLVAAPPLARSAHPLQLTPRENDVAAFLVLGYTYKRIARELERRDGRPVSDNTIRAHVGNIAWKLGVTENAKTGVMAEIARRGLRFPMRD